MKKLIIALIVLMAIPVYAEQVSVKFEFEEVVTDVDGAPITVDGYVLYAKKTSWNAQWDWEWEMASYNCNYQNLCTSTMNIDLPVGSYKFALIAYKGNLKSAKSNETATYTVTTAPPDPKVPGKPLNFRIVD